MSASTRSRSPRSGGKSVAPKKKSKKAKSEFHGKRKFAPTAGEADKKEVVKRALESLDHLGKQKFSKEPGGYDLRSWMKSLKTLLDDLEKKVGAEHLTEEFRAKREEVEAEFSKKRDTAQIDAEIQAARKEESDIKAKLKEESERIAARLSAIGGEKTGRGLALDEERGKLKKVEEERRSVSFFSKLVGKSGPSTEPFQKKVQELESELKMLEEETTNLQAVRKSIEGAKSAAGGIYEELWKRMEGLQVKLQELDVAREARLHLEQEREAAAAGLRKVIEGLKLEDQDEEAVKSTNQTSTQ